MKQRKEYLSWKEYFMQLAELTSRRSKDPSTQVGSVIVKDNKIVSIGYNGAPNGFSDDEFPWGREGDYLETKYPYVCHSELNAISNYDGPKSNLKGSTLYVTLFPCNECTKLIIQNGIKKVVYKENKYPDSDEVKASTYLLEKCGVEYIKYSDEIKK